MDKLTGYSRFSGCGAKIAPQLLDRALCNLSQPRYPEVLADFSGNEDAGVYQISEDQALVQTIDFFPPITEDPGTFGEIAAANALSDIYAMGGRPISAVSVLCFPEENLPIDVLRTVMEGALKKFEEGGIALLGGHSVRDQEFKFGFAVNGLVHPQKVVRNNTPREGDSLLLTKSLGTGAINSATRGGLASPRAVREAERSMRALNKRASELMGNYQVSACTDITGFGLAGHGVEMILPGEMDLVFNIGELPLLPEVMGYIAMGLVPEGTHKNKKSRQSFIQNPHTVSSETLDLLFDPQTSGGLLISLPEEEAVTLQDALEGEGLEGNLIGVVRKGQGKIILDA